MRLAFDIDGTLCTNTQKRYSEAKPHTAMINLVNALHDAGHYIIIHTARGMGRNDNVSGKAHTMLYRFTQNQLDDWGVKYNELQLGKLHVDLFVDDKGFRVKEDGSSVKDLEKFIEEYKEI